jgi:hypothetical protein
MTSVRGILFRVLLYTTLASPASADVRILASPGGEVGGFLELFAVLRQSGERIVIDGPCFSACTLVLNTIPEDRICVTRRAVLGFHAAREVDRRGREYAAPDATRVVTETYPAGIRAWIKRRGGLTQKPIFLRGRELAAVLPRCG